MEDETPHGEASRLPPYAVSRWRGNSLGAAVSLRFGLGACDFSLNAASGTGAQVAFLAGTLLRAGLADVIVAVAADPHLPPILAKAMRSSGSVVQGTLPRPLSAGRTGMNPTEGAACLIFESAQHAIARGAKPLAEWLGGQTACEAKHLLAPDSDAAVLQSLLETCVAAYAPVGPGDHGVDWISLHATGTPRFDNVEVGCLQRVFPTRMPWLSAIKRTTGHALGASGLIEAAILADGLQSGHTPAWPENTDPALGLELVRPVAAPAPPQIAFQIGQGMGGVVVVNAFAAVNPPTPQNRPLKIPGEMGENAH
jgi:3-oxoacyl-(acyl-carrier-protein) synthase